MFDKDAIEALNLGTAEAISTASNALQDEGGAKHLAALPDNFTVHDLEKYLPNRRRARGTMKTQVVGDFANYVEAHKEEGAAVFVSVDAMEATAVLNLGTPSAPGHADSRAVYAAKPTAAYRALMAVATGSAMSQVKVAEFLEDWGHLIECQHDSEAITLAQAVAAVRDITIEGLRKQGNTEAQLSATRTTFDEVKATSKEKIPTLMRFTCIPYVDLQQRDFMVRLSIQTGGDKPSLVLRIVKQEEHQEQMGRELVDLIKFAQAASTGGASIPVLIGTYSSN